MYTQASANKDQSAPNLVKKCMTNRSRMSSSISPLGWD